MLFIKSLFLTASFVCVLCENKDGGKAPRLPLNDGNSIPALGLGTFLGFDEHGQKEVKDGEVELPVTLALNAGYRLFDTAQAYKNEHQVGKAVRESSVPREDVYIVTKLASNKQDKPVGSLFESLKEMNLSYVDLYLIHNPVAFTPDEKAYAIIDYKRTWKGMEVAKNNGLARSIGVSNFNISQLERLMEHSEIKPAVLQVEVNLNLAQDKLLEFCKEHDIVVMAYTPFGGLFDKTTESPPPRADDPELVKIAEKYKKSTPQVVLKYLVQRGVVPIPKSIRKEKIEENINIFDFELTPEEMTTLSKFNKDYRTVNPSFWQDHPYYPFEKTDTPAPDPFKRNKE
ncbi:aldo-keto reductase AKR2E4-like [Pectinophora gossypiella]|uniref:aldo-keto reductase AKR2E4-like n=1 Tax=Pectinophora gossypiella TaxID=13191 RepID=UPI00214EB88C|nr:aldo-keto reductase AKR2E4-like [Pectinophora gossypiella]